MRIQLHAEASRELDNAIDWYEAQQAGLGVAFLREVSRAFDVIAANPGMWPVWPGSRARGRVRRFVLHRFPFSIAYIARREHVLILAVAHGWRRPGYWQERARSR